MTSLFELAAAYALAAGFVYVVYLIIFQYTYWKRRKMLYLRSIPFVGNTGPLLFQTSSFPVHLQNLYNGIPKARYIGIFNFLRPSIIVRDPEIIRDICIKNFENFVDHETFINEEMDPIVGRNLFSLKGQRWKEVRNTLTPSFSAARMKVMFELIAECSRDFVRYFEDHPEVAKSFEAKDVFTRYTNDVIGTAAFGIKVDSMKNPENELYLSNKDSTEFTFWRFLKIQAMRRFPRLMRLAGATFLSKSSDRLLKSIIIETVKTRREKGIVRQDMIQLLMQAMDKEDGPTVTIDDIIGQAFFFILAGFDTSSSLMCFLCHELAANPDIQERLYREIDKHLEIDDGQITYDSLSKLKYLDMVISETLRKYPSAPFTNRVCIKECSLPPPAEGHPNYLIDKNTLVFIPIYAIHRDPRFFPNPERFDPERFADDNKSTILPYSYLPFGLGPRHCIGNRFALMEAKIVIIDVLRKFRIKFTDKTQHPIVLNTSGFNLSAKNGFWMKFRSRKKFN